MYYVMIWVGQIVHTDTVRLFSVIRTSVLDSGMAISRVIKKISKEILRYSTGDCVQSVWCHNQFPSNVSMFCCSEVDRYLEI